jgi:hypothetical protein
MRGDEVPSLLSKLQDTQVLELEWVASGERAKSLGR